MCSRFFWVYKLAGDGYHRERLPTAALNSEVNVSQVGVSSTTVFDLMSQFTRLGLVLQFAVKPFWSIEEDTDVCHEWEGSGFNRLGEVGAFESQSRELETYVNSRLLALTREIEVRR